jgi:hypothetical protein
MKLLAILVEFATLLFVRAAFPTRGAFLQSVRAYAVRLISALQGATA